VKKRSPWLLPQEPAAWWAFGSSTLAGLLAVGRAAPPERMAALVLALACACLFCSSDWISSLYGRGYRGSVVPGELASPLGLGLCASALCLLAAFYLFESPQGPRFWAVALMAPAALTILMFVMRLQLPALDDRLVLLSSLLCTLPALLQAFLVWGHAGFQAWAFWIFPALFFPVSSLFSQAWLRGASNGPPPLVALSLPLLGLCLASAAMGFASGALFASLYLAYTLQRLLRRYGEGAALPSFGVIHSFAREQAAWNGAFVLVWLSRQLGA
jgi:hypothetical protein